MINTHGTEKFRPEHLKIILQETERLEKISNEILDYSKETKLEVCSRDLEDVISDTLEIIRDKLRELKSRNDNVRVVLNSAYSTYKNDFATWFADAYVVKSTDLTELKTRLKEFAPQPPAALSE